MEQKKIELEDALHKECIRAEKQEAMIDMLTKIAEDRLEEIGIVRDKDESPLDAFLNAKEMTFKMEEMGKEREDIEADLLDAKEEIKHLEKKIIEQEEINKELVQYKIKVDSEILNLRKQEISQTQELKLLQQSIMEHKNTESRLKTEIKSEQTQLANQRTKNNFFEKIIEKYEDFTKIVINNIFR